MSEVFLLQRRRPGHPGHSKHLKWNRNDLSLLETIYKMGGKGWVHTSHYENRESSLKGVGKDSSRPRLTIHAMGHVGRKTIVFGFLTIKQKVLHTTVI